MKTVLVTGSSGLIGSEVVRHFAARGWITHGVDNNLRADFFGPGSRVQRVSSPAIPRPVVGHCCSHWRSPVALTAQT